MFELLRINGTIIGIILFTDKVVYNNSEIAVEIIDRFLIQVLIQKLTAEISGGNDLDPFIVFKHQQIFISADNVI